MVMDWGAAAEKRALQALGIHLPNLQWLLSVRMANQYEDRYGADVIAETDMGWIGVQIKASRGAARRTRKARYKSRGIPVVVVTRDAPIKVIGKWMIDAISKRRAELVVVGVVRKPPTKDEALGDIGPLVSLGDKLREWLDRG